MASRETVSALSSCAVRMLTFTLMLGSSLPSRLSTSHVISPTVRVPRTMTVVGIRVSVPSDRKSTRLNSSHDQISYAVFCLKKKKKEKTQLPIEREQTHYE